MAHAELGQRAVAIAKAQAALALLEQTGQPQAPVFRDQLRKYCGADAASAVLASPALLGVGLVNQVNSKSLPRPQEQAGLLRMAFSAARAMLKALQSGCVTVAPELARQHSKCVVNARTIRACAVRCVVVLQT